MTAWREPIRLPLPLYDARLAGSTRAGSLDLLTRETEQSGYERGREETERTLRAQLERQREELNELQNGVLVSLRQSIAQVARECESTLVSLALEVARKLVAGMPISEAHVEATVRDALADIENKTGLRVQLHPEDLTLLERVESPLLRSGTGAEQITFEVSSEVTRGGCIVQTNFGSIDARRETKFEVLRDVLQN